MSDYIKEEDNIIFCFSDLKNLVLRSRKLIFLFSIMCCLLTLCFYCKNPPLYQSQALYKDGEVLNNMNESFKSMFMSYALGSNSDGKAISLMMTNAVLKPVVEELGLQISLSGKRKFRSYLSNFFSHIKVITKSNIKDENIFEFKNVVYEGELTTNFILFFHDKNNFELFVDEKCIGKYQINQPVQTKDIKLTIVNVPTSLKLKKHYKFNVLPTNDVASFYKKKLIIKPQKNNSILS